MDFLRFLITRQFLKHLGLAAAISVILLLATLLGLRIYTHHGQTIMVPDLSGLTEQEVSEVTAARNLRYEVIDSVFSSEMPRGTVVKQNPGASAKVKKHRKIFLTLNAINPETVPMPRLVGLSIRQARLAMQNAGLTLGEIRYRPDFAVNNVLEQLHADSMIAEGTEIRKGEVIDLVLGMVSDENTRVPDLVGVPLEAARDIILDYYLNLGAVTYDESMENAEDSALAFVWRQYPEFDEFKRMQMGLEVDVWVTIDSTLLPQPDSMFLPGETEPMNEDL